MLISTFQLICSNSMDCCCCCCCSFSFPIAAAFIIAFVAYNISVSILLHFSAADVLGACSLRYCSSSRTHIRLLSVLFVVHSILTLYSLVARFSSKYFIFHSGISFTSCHRRQHRHRRHHHHRYCCCCVRYRSHMYVRSVGLRTQQHWYYNTIFVTA